MSINQLRFFEMLFAANMMLGFENSRPVPDFDDKPVYQPPKKNVLIKLKSGQFAFRIDNNEAITKLLVDSSNPNDKAIILARSMKGAMKKAKKRVVFISKI